MGKIGAKVLTVDLIAVSILRELGVLLTAIVIAGRSASTFAAEIGSMKLQEEIKAMGTMGINVIDVLVIPRIIAPGYCLAYSWSYRRCNGFAGRRRNVSIQP